MTPGVASRVAEIRARVKLAEVTKSAFEQSTGPGGHGRDINKVYNLWFEASEAIKRNAMDDLRFLLDVVEQQWK